MGCAATALLPQGRVLGPVPVRVRLGPGGDLVEVPEQWPDEPVIASLRRPLEFPVLVQVAQPGRARDPRSRRTAEMEFGETRDRVQLVLWAAREPRG